MKNSHGLDKFQYSFIWASHTMNSSNTNKDMGQSMGFTHLYLIQSDWSQTTSVVKVQTNPNNCGCYYSASLIKPEKVEKYQLTDGLWEIINDQVNFGYFFLIMIDIL